MDELRFGLAFAVLPLQYPQHRVALADRLAFVHGQASRFVDDQQVAVLKNDVELRRHHPRWGTRPLLVEGNVELDLVAGAECICRFGALAVQANAVLAKQLADITYWEFFLEVVL